MSRQRRVAGLIIAGVAALGGLAGCGSDASAGAFLPKTPSPVPAALRQAAAAAPTATPIPDNQ
jgi:hypothetical protein